MNNPGIHMPIWVGRLPGSKMRSKWVQRSGQPSAGSPAKIVGLLEMLFAKAGTLMVASFGEGVRSASEVAVSMGLVMDRGGSDQGSADPIVSYSQEDALLMSGRGSQSFSL